MALHSPPMDDLVQQLQQPRQCVHCRETFSERQSMGTLGCRRHTGELQTIYPSAGRHGRLGTWSCCGVADAPTHREWRGRDAALGCQACDHTDTMGMPVNETLPYERALVLFGEDLRARRTLYVPERREITIIRVGGRK